MEKRPALAPDLTLWCGQARRPQVWSPFCQPCHLDRLRGIPRSGRLRGSGEIPTMRPPPLRYEVFYPSCEWCAAPTQLRLNQTRACWCYVLSHKLWVYILWSESGNALPGIVLRLEFPESATRRANPRNLSTPSQSLRFFVVGRDDRSLFLVHFSAPALAAAVLPRSQA